MPKWLVQTLCDNRLATPFFSRTHSGSHHASYTHDTYAFSASSMCNEEDPISFDEAHSSENWMAAMQMATMQIEYDAIMKNGT